jgi:DNA-binding transcriptional LysR family regulator
LADSNLAQSVNIMQKLQKKGHHFSRVIESSSLEVISNLIANSVGVGIVPSRVLKQYEQTKLEKVKDAPVFHDRICLVYKPEFKKLKRAEAFLKSFKIGS